MRNLLCTLVFLFSVPSLLAQDVKADSLSRLIEQSKTDTSRVGLMLKLGKHLRNTDLNRAIEVGKETLELSEKLQFNAGSAAALNHIGVCYYFLNNYTEVDTYKNLIV